MPIGFDLLRNGTDIHDSHLSSSIKMSVPGMAHFAEQGTRNRCGKCKFFDLNKSKPKAKQPCSKYKQLMGKSDTVDRKIPHDTRACKYYEARS